MRGKERKRKRGISGFYDPGETAPAIGDEFCSTPARAPSRGPNPRGVARRGFEGRRAATMVVHQAAENAERRELIPVRKKSFDRGF